MKVSCPAKLNIGLKINSKRPDGYHDLETEFRLISLYDYLEIKESKNIVEMIFFILKNLFKD